MLLQPHSRCCCLPHHAAARASPNHPAFASAFAGFDQQVAMLPHAFACLTCPLHAGLLACITWCPEYAFKCVYGAGQDKEPALPEIRPALPKVGAREYAEIEEKAAAEVQAEAKEKVRLSHSCVVKRVRHGEWASIV
eukprot:scaffold67115_cov19-Tisochrysis_lutea.AAC.3